MKTKAFLAVALTLWAIPFIPATLFILRQDPGVTGQWVALNALLIGAVQWVAGRMR